MVAPTDPPRKGFMRKIYTALGFSKGYNFTLWFIFAGAMFGFCLARFMYINFHKHFCPAVRGPGMSGGALPGECFYYLNITRYKVGIIMHLGTILPAGLLAVFQFTPIIRHKWIIFHRINGYLVLTLYILSTIGALMIARHAFGGGLDIQSVIGALAISTIGSFVMSFINIKRLQIEQHRAWMLRGWFYAASIITSRLVMILAAVIITSDDYYSARPCGQLASIHETPEKTLALYPDCAAYFNGTNDGLHVMVRGTMEDGVPSQIAVAFGMSFGMAIWVSFWLHAVGVEIYLQLTPAEAERLRRVSYQRQLEAGLNHPGSAGLTADRLGDSEPWLPPAVKDRKVSDSSLPVEDASIPR